MTAEQKARELVEKFYIFNHIGNSHAKKCALICVDEILETTKEPVLPMGGATGFDYSEYWQAVKTELEKLK